MRGMAAGIALTWGLALQAEQACGTLVREATSIRGTVRQVEPLDRRELVVTPCDLDPRFAITIEIEGGETRVLAVHSPARTFGAESPVDKTFDLQLVSRSCDGVFRRFEELRLDSGVIEDFESWLEVGRTYRASVQRDTDGELRLVNRIRVPFHHAAALDWTNAAEFPSLVADDRERTIVFAVVAQRVWQVSGRWEWRDLFEAKIVSVP